jgi:hypothetical protein
MQVLGSTTLPSKVGTSIVQSSHLHVHSFGLRVAM